MGHGNRRFNQSRSLPPVRPESPDVEALRVHGSVGGGSGPGGIRTPEDDVPAGKIWVPDAASHVSKRRQQELKIPDFIPQKLDGDLSPMQRDIAASVVAEQIKQGSRAPTNIPKALQPTHGSNTMLQDTRELPDDFDPEVDDPDDVVGGSAALSPDAESAQQREQLQETMRQRRISNAQQQAMPGNTGSARADKTVDLSKKPGLMHEHPLLAKLRSRYTISALDIRYKTIDGIKYGFRKHSNQAYLKFVTNKVIPTIDTDAELSDKHAYALAAISLASIDDVPTWQVFGIDIEQEVERAWVDAEPMNPPTTVVVKTADAIYHMFIMDGIPEFGDTIARAYNELFPDIDIVGDDGTWVYKCMVTGCQERFEHIPETDSDGNPKPYYCPIHGSAMSPLGSKGDLRNVPLD